MTDLQRKTIIRESLEEAFYKAVGDHMNGAAFLRLVEYVAIGKGADDEALDELEATVLADPRMCPVSKVNRGAWD